MRVPESPPKPGEVATPSAETNNAAPKEDPSHEEKGLLSHPTEPGVWRKNEDRHKWTMYAVEIAEIIFTAFANGDTFVEWGTNSIPRKRRRDGANTMENNTVTHRVEFSRMKEVDLAAKSERDIMIIQAPISELNYTPSVNPVETGVWWNHNNGKWHCYPESTEETIRSAWRKKEHYVIVQRSPSLRSPQGEGYIINLHTMKQTDPGTGQKHPIRMISNLCMPDGTVPAKENKNLTVISLSATLLEQSIERLVSREFVQVRLAKMVKYPYKLQAVEMNSYLRGVEGSKYSRNEVQRVYKEFRTSIDNIIRTVPGCCGQLLRIVRQTADSDEVKVRTPNSKAMLRHLFYWAPASKVTSILRNGLDTVIAQTPRDCFRPCSDEFEEHCNVDGLLKLLVFLALVPRSVSDSSLGNAIPIADLNHYLPIAAVTLKSLEPQAHNNVSSGGHVDPSDDVEQERASSSPTPSFVNMPSGEPGEEKEVPVADFHDFTSYRTETDVAVGQIWALYDDQDGMPRFYGFISEVSLSPTFSVDMRWLDPHPITEAKKLWMRSTGLGITCGEFQLASSSVIKQEVNFFSHKIMETCPKGLVKIYPKKSQVWAVFRDWDQDQRSGPKKINNRHGHGHTYMYEMVEILDDYSEEEGVSTVKLVKVWGFKTLFVQDDAVKGSMTFRPSEMQRFSHRVPAERLYGNDALDIPRGALELDPASTPIDLIVATPDETS